MDARFLVATCQIYTGMFSQLYKFTVILIISDFKTLKVLTLAFCTTTTSTSMFTYSFYKRFFRAV